MQKLKLVSIISFFLLMTPNGVFGQKPAPRISATGFGPVKIGMTQKQASKAIGLNLISEGDPTNGCHYISARLSARRGLTDLGFMVIDGKIARVDTHSRVYRTIEGARVGDSEARIKRLYRGRVKIELHKYIDGHYLIVGNKRSAIIFETDGKKVTMIRAGRHPEVGFVEGCS